MGNGSSQSVVIGQNRPLANNIFQNRYQQRTPKYAHPQNRVLPNPVAGQRLRSTDNGHILHSAGTIRGLKPGSPLPQDLEEGDREVLDILKRRSEIIEKEQNCSEVNLRNQRMYYSDPDISRTRQDSGYSPEVPENGVGNRRMAGATATKANKLKQRKKSRAPDPPPPGENYHAHFQRRAQSSSDLTASRQQTNNGDCRCVIPEWKPKNRAPPPPPPSNGTPPEPPPLPELRSSQDKASRYGSRSAYTDGHLSPSKSSSLSPEMVAKSGNPGIQTKQPNKYAAQEQRRWSGSEQRPTVFNSKTNISGQNKKPSLLQHKPDPFQKEIEEVTKKIAQNRQLGCPTPSVAASGQKDSSKVTSPKRYYFCDKDLCRSEKKTTRANSDQDGVRRLGQENSDLSNACGMQNDAVQPSAIPRQEDILLSNEDSPLQRFSPIRRRSRDPRNASLEKPGRNIENPVSESPPIDDEKNDIDLRLRPVLPRKTPEIPKFSPTEAWQALGSDGQGSSNQSTSDESVQRYLQGAKIYPKKETGRFFGSSDSKNGSRSSYNCTPSESQWTPRQDLNDSDTSSLDSDEVVVPKTRISEFPTRFSLPTVMFSNIRPIGAETPGRQQYYDRDDDPYSNRRKKSQKYGDPRDGRAVSNFRRLLGMRNKYLSEEDVCVSDSNWTFGGYGLQHQKRGKQYSSDWLLSDKRKYEILTRNNYGGFPGDALVTKPGASRNSFILGDANNPNFSFYSTDGHVMYLPKPEGGPSQVRGKQNHSRKKFSKSDQSQPLPKNLKKQGSGYDIELERARSRDVARMLEDEVRRNRNKEKIAIRQQLRMMKRLDSDGEDTEEEEDEEVDEAYFTEPKSLDGSSPLHLPPAEIPYMEEAPSKYDRKTTRGGSSSRGADSKPLMHWKSSPALLDDDNTSKPFTAANGFHSSSSLTSSPDPVAWQHSAPAEKWPQRKQQSHVRRTTGKYRRASEGDDSTAPGRCSGDGESPPTTGSKTAAPPAKEKKTTSIYKQLMEIVRREEKYLKKAEGQEYDASRESSYSQRESSHSSSSSHDSVSSSSNSYSDCSSPQAQDDSGKSGVPANNEFHSATGLDIDRSNNCRDDFLAQQRQNKNPAFHAAFVQPYSPNKSYRPVHFEVKAAPSTCRVPILQESHKAQAEVS